MVNGEMKGNKAVIMLLFTDTFMKLLSFFAGVYW